MCVFCKKIKFGHFFPAFYGQHSVAEAWTNPSSWSTHSFIYSVNHCYSSVIFSCALFWLVLLITVWPRLISCTKPQFRKGGTDLVSAFISVLSSLRQTMKLIWLNKKQKQTWLLSTVRIYLYNLATRVSWVYQNLTKLPGKSEFLEFSHAIYL